MAHKSALVLLSGGQDSATCLFWALTRYAKVFAIGFDYEQRHKLELIYAQKLANQVNVPYHIYQLNPIFSGSTLTNLQDQHDNPSPINQNLPSSFVPMRNALFLTLAAAYAVPLGIRTLICGVSQEDYSGYPDCRAEFIESQAHSLSLALGEKIEIQTPLMYCSKALVWKMAWDLSTENTNVLEIIRTSTLTDYDGRENLKEWGRGELDNPATKLRAKGYWEAKDKGWIP